MLETLVKEDGISSRSIAERINMPDRTVRYALKILKSKNLVKMSIILGDTRKKVYNLNKEVLEDRV